MPLQLCEPGRNTLPLLHLRLPLLQEELQVNPGDEGPLHNHCWRDWKPQQLINKGWYNIGDDASKTIVPTNEIQVIFKLSIVEKEILWLWWLCDINQSGVILICFVSEIWCKTTEPASSTWETVLQSIDHLKSEDICNGGLSSLQVIFILFFISISKKRPF